MTDPNAPRSAEIQCRIIPHGGASYREMVGLRYRVLREPLGLHFAPEQLAAEADDTLIGAYADGKIIGSVILTRQSEGVAQMRQVAVEEIRQGQGIGRIMLEFAEQAAKGRGFSEITLHARETAFIFYERLGYTPFGESFEEVGLPHREMRKILI